ncbi:hypothetical protein D3C86_1940370 [compost metagenome]
MAQHAGARRHEADVAAVLRQLILHVCRQMFRRGNRVMIHKGIVLRMDDQRRFGYLVQQRHGATLTIIVDGVSKAVDLRGDHIVKLAQATHTLQLLQADGQGVWIGLQLTCGVSLE